jgi:predicted nicotinamide N-methyase
VELSLLRPVAPDALISEEEYAKDEYLPYWADLWPASRALADVLPVDLLGQRVVELGCGLGVPSLVAAARGALVTATDWSEDAIALLRRNAGRNGLDVKAVVHDWRDDWPEGRFDLAIASDIVYELRYVEPLAMLLPQLAPTALLGLGARPYEMWLLELLDYEHVTDRVVRVSFPGASANGGGG